MQTKPQGKIRWTICAMIFAATTINLLDRQVLVFWLVTYKKRLAGTKCNMAIS
jgi:ACS family hexuronate transporter-like MFS transporter